MASKFAAVSRSLDRQFISATDSNWFTENQNKMRRSQLGPGRFPSEGEIVEDSRRAFADEGQILSIRSMKTTGARATASCRCRHDRSGQPGKRPASPDENLVSAKTVGEPVTPIPSAMVRRPPGAVSLEMVL